MHLSSAHLFLKDWEVLGMDALKVHWLHVAPVFLTLVPPVAARRVGFRLSRACVNSWFNSWPLKQELTWQCFIEATLCSLRPQKAQMMILMAKKCFRWKQPSFLLETQRWEAPSRAVSFGAERSATSVGCWQMGWECSKPWLDLRAPKGMFGCKGSGVCIEGASSACVAT